MARTGINKEEVLTARNALLARGERPSIDAVRYELGNTGSRSTILRFLRELEESEPAAAPDTLSEELLMWVAGLAERLKLEGRAPIAALETQLEEERQQWAAERDKTQEREAAWQLQREENAQALAAQTAINQHLVLEQQQQAIELARLNQLQQDQSTRLAEREQHIQSLEEKHQHAREALEHYRIAAQTQREQESRRHELQVQQMQMELRQAQQSVIVQQEEASRLHRENERLLSEQRAARLESDQWRNQAQQHMESLMASQRQIARLETLDESRQLQMNQAAQEHAQRLSELFETQAKLLQQLQAAHEQERHLQAQLAEARLALQAALRHDAAPDASAITAEGATERS